jgi:hypothetical protein
MEKAIAAGSLIGGFQSIAVSESRTRSEYDFVVPPQTSSEYFHAIDKGPIGRHVILKEPSAEWLAMHVSDTSVNFRDFFPIGRVESDVPMPADCCVLRGEYQEVRRRWAWNRRVTDKQSKHRPLRGELDDEVNLRQNK